MAGDENRRAVHCQARRPIILLKLENGLRDVIRRAKSSNVIVAQLLRHQYIAGNVYATAKPV